MATPQPNYYRTYPYYSQDVFAAGSYTIFTCPADKAGSITRIRITNPNAYNISVDINKVNPVSTVRSFAFTLNAGDLVVDNTIYTMEPGDTITLTTSANDTNVIVSGTVLPIATL